MSNPGLPPPPPPPPGGPEQPPPPPAGAGWAVEVDDLYLDYAGFWQRAAAAVVDWLIVAVPVGIGAVALIVALPREEPQLCELPDGSVGICEPFTAASIVVLLLAGIGWFCFMLFFWYGHLVGTKGVTPGRAALGIQVVDESGTRPIGFGRGVARYLIFSVMGFAICLPLLSVLWVAWDDRKQALHDKVVSSVVVRRR